MNHFRPIEKGPPAGAVFAPRRVFYPIWALALLALLLSALTPSVSAAWQCEGRTCSTTAWACCCDMPVEEQDRNCQASTRPVTENAGCATDCGCVLTVRITDAARTRLSLTALQPALSPAMLPGAPLTVAPLPREIPTAPVETGALPPRLRPWNTPALRAPPSA